MQPAERDGPLFGRQRADAQGAELAVKLRQFIGGVGRQRRIEPVEQRLHSGWRGRSDWVAY